MLVFFMAIPMSSIAITNTRGGHADFQGGQVPLVIVRIGFVLAGGRTGG
jgi:hypothetical protein